MLEACLSFAEKAAALLHSIAWNHALGDGNMRLAWSAIRVLCLLNGRDFALGVDEAEAMVLRAATGGHDVAALAEVVATSLRDA